MKGQIGFASAVCALLIVTPALANGADDAAAVVKAYDNKQFAEVVRLSTSALKAPALSKERQELLYLKRGEAYFQLGNVELAKADVTRATILKPDDQEAQGVLKILAGAEPAPVPQVQQASRPVPAAAVGARVPAADWGALGSLAGQYWMQISSKAEAYALYQWEVPGQVLSYTGMDSKGNPVAGRYMLDPQSGHITGVAISRGETSQVEVEILPGGYVETGTVKGAPSRQTLQRVNTGSLTVQSQVFQNGAWKDGASNKFVQVSADVVQALGWQANPVAAKTPSFLSNLGNAIKSGALSGIADGLREGVQARTRGAVAPNAYPGGAPAVAVTATTTP